MQQRRISMNVFEMKLQSCDQGSLGGERGYWSAREPQRWGLAPRGLAAALSVIAVMLAVAASARAQSIECLPEGQKLVTVPELISKDGKLRATILLSDEQQRMAFRIPVSAPSDTSRSQCFPQHVRTFRD
jgi:hypothetical protein